MVIGHNTDIEGFELAIKHTNYDIVGKNIYIRRWRSFSINNFLALNNMSVKKIFISNRTQSKAENLKKNFNEIEIIRWGTIPDFDMIINATSLGLKNDENIIFRLFKN